MTAHVRACVHDAYHTTISTAINFAYGGLEMTHGERMLCCILRCRTALMVEVVAASTAGDQNHHAKSFEQVCLNTILLRIYSVHVHEFGVQAVRVCYDIVVPSVWRRRFLAGVSMRFWT